MAFLTFREIKRQVQAKIQNTSDSTTYDNDLLPKIKDWINERYARIYRSHYWRDTINDYTLTLTASQAEYAFDRDVYEIISILDQTNGIPVTEDSIQDHVRNYEVNYDTYGVISYDNPARYRITGTHTVKSEIGNTGEQIDIVSSSASDVSPNCVHIKGLVNGIEVEEDITLTGTTTATSTNTAYTKIYTFASTAACTCTRTRTRTRACTGVFRCACECGCAGACVCVYACV